jgi:hypothetical protein
MGGGRATSRLSQRGRLGRSTLLDLMVRTAGSINNMPPAYIVLSAAAYHASLVTCLWEPCSTPQRLSIRSIRPPSRVVFDCSSNRPRTTQCPVRECARQFGIGSSRVADSHRLCGIPQVSRNFISSTSSHSDRWLPQPGEQRRGMLCSRDPAFAARPFVYDRSRCLTDFPRHPEIRFRLA